MRRLSAIALVVATIPAGVWAEGESQALVNCAALIDARYSDPVFSQEQYATIPFSISAMLQFTTREAEDSDAEEIEKLFRDRACDYRARLGPLPARHAESGNLRDWMHRAFDQREGVMRRNKDEIATLIVEKVLKQ